MLDFNVCLLHLGIEYYPKGQVKFEGEFKNDLKNGKGK